MKTKLQKSLKYLAGAAFLFALAVNVIITLDDPFVLMSDSVIAQTTTNSTGSSTGGWRSVTYFTSGCSQYYCDCYGMPTGSDSCIQQICDFDAYETCCYVGGPLPSCQYDMYITNKRNCQNTGQMCSI